MMGELTPSNGTVPKLGEEPPVSRQPIDYFAEQNQKREEQRQKIKKVLKWVIPVVAVVVLLVVVASVFLIIRHVQDSAGPVVADNSIDENSSESIKAGLDSAEQLKDQIVEIYEPTYSIQDGEIIVDGNMEGAESAFESALSNPANKNRVNTIYLSQIIFYSDYGKYQNVVDVAEKVDPSRLNLTERVKFYNLVYLAYISLGNTEKADQYFALLDAEARKLNIGSNGEEGK